MPFKPTDFGKPIMLTLKRNADTRYAEAMGEVCNCPGWPFPIPRPFYGIDGQVEGVYPPPHVANPVLQQLSRGGWGCQLSYLNLIYDHLESGDEWRVILEDDLWLVDAFAEKVTEYLSQVPDDADCIYIGGNPHSTMQFPPVRIAEHVCRPWRVTATHFCIFRRSFSKAIFRWLLSIPTRQMDAIFAQFHSMSDPKNTAHGGRFNVYFPYGYGDHALAGQVMGQSDIQRWDVEAPKLQRMNWGVPLRRRLKEYGSDVTERVGGNLHERSPEPDPLMEVA